MKRLVEPELLDELPHDDPRAIQSRRDLRKINSLMGNVGIIERPLLENFPDRSPKQIVELGAGDGAFALNLAKKLSVHWKKVGVTLVDRQKTILPETLFTEIGWDLEVIQADVFDWLARCEPVDCIIANLFLHHFDDGNLSRLLCLAASKTKVFVACEPRRTSLCVVGTKLLWAIGCNEVTRHDAQVSVRAGFRERELSGLWPKTGDWRTSEGDRGIFSHGFVATRL